MVVKLTSITGGKRSGEDYNLLRPLCVKQRGTVSLPTNKAFQYCVGRCVKEHRRRRHLEERGRVAIRVREYNRKLDNTIMECVTTSRLWMRCIQRARKLVHLRNEQRVKWYASEDERKRVCCGLPRHMTSRQVRKYHDCRACNLGVLSSNCSCYYYDDKEETWTCNQCGDVFLPRLWPGPYPPSIRRWQFDAYRHRFPQLSSRYAFREGGMRGTLDYTAFRL